MMIDLMMELELYKCLVCDVIISLMQSLYYDVIMYFDVFVIIKNPRIFIKSFSKRANTRKIFQGFAESLRQRALIFMKF
jgi:hypothetical protein